MIGFVTYPEVWVEPLPPPPSRSIFVALIERELERIRGLHLAQYERTRIRIFPPLRAPIVDHDPGDEDPSERPEWRWVHVQTHWWSGVHT